MIENTFDHEQHQSGCNTSTRARDGNRSKPGRAVGHGRSHAPALRAKVVAELAAGAGLNETCRKYGIHASTAIRWRAEDGPLHPDREELRLKLGLLIYDTVTDMLNATRAQLQTTTNEDWLREQTAGELAELIGVELDRAIRLLAGLRPANDAEPETSAHHTATP